VIGIGLGFVSYAKVIDDKAEHYFSSVVPKEARGIGTLRVAIFVEVLDQSGLAELASLGKAVHAFPYFKVDVVVVYKRGQVVLGDNSRGEFIDVDAKVFVSRRRKRCAEVEVCNIDGYPFEVARDDRVY
jgi:hypothetical protein